MPATEQTWRDSKLLHLVFGISGLAMLITTIWMLAADHRREWKDFQSKFQSIETWTAEARLQQQLSDDFIQQEKAADVAWEEQRHKVPDRDLVDKFQLAVQQDAQRRKEAAPVEIGAITSAYKATAEADKEAIPAKREKLREELQKFVGAARFREEKLASDKKFLSAALDEVRSKFDLGVGNELPKSELEEYQKQVTEQMHKVDEANLQVQQAKTYRVELETILSNMFAGEADAKKKLDDLVDKRRQLEKALYERENHAMTEVVGLPIIDAFQPKKIDQIWLPKLTIYNNFSDVARFDRCVNCHQAMDKTAPGSAVDPLYPEAHSEVVSLETPAAAPEELKDKPSDPAKLAEFYDALVLKVYGLKFARRGMLESNEATINVVQAESPAAKAKLFVGDTITEIGNARILDRGYVFNYLVESAAWGKPLKLTVRRGAPHPYASHPRLDLFVGSLSPHRMADMGCTVCHDGQGSATAFKWASHSPDNPDQAKAWKREHGWFDNHHWIFPMYPKRFAESLCLKCHHDVTELEPSERFPEPPAPKLMAGFHLIEDFGCYGCHEINGFDGPNKRIGPDLRTEPNYAAAAEALLAVGLDKQQAVWAKDLVADPTNASARHSLTESLRTAEKLPGNANTTKRLVNVLDDVESPGRLRKVGPSLRHVASKVNYEFLYSWIRKPSDFRPSTKMPQFFGLWGHLSGEGLHEAEQFEPLEIQGAAEFLLAKSQPFEFAKSSGEGSAERGKLAFEIRCLACHQHNDFPAGKMTQGPDLSRIGGKLKAAGNPDGPKWLYSWLKNPSRYHARTVMPNMMLDVVDGPDGKKVDPAADIAAFLLNSNEGDWKPTDIPNRKLDGPQLDALDALAMESLKNVFTRHDAEEYLKTGIPESRAGELKGDEVELVGEMTPEKKLRYVGRRAISKYGCAGCHDVPGFEDAKPIGTGLADWARKTPDKLAFEQVLEYIKHGHGTPGRLIEPVGAQPKSVSDKTLEEADHGPYGHTHFSLETAMAVAGPANAYFLEKLFGHQREGFIWQKLREPRSYDFEKTQNKSYNERLRMPQFTGFDDEKREQVITFVLGLVAEPPASQYIYKPSPRAKAIQEGWQVVEKFNCTGCHTLQQERWKLAYAPDAFAAQNPPEDYKFLEPHFTAQQLKVATTPDVRGLLRATVVGTPVVDEEGKSQRIDEGGVPIEADDTETPGFVPVQLWEPVLLGGIPRIPGVRNILVPEGAIEKHYPPVGGTLARLAFPVVVAEEKKVNPQVNAGEAWGWLPPPLVGEGKKVQSNWLYEFLLDPHMIRPAAMLRMPKFNMSPADATKLVNYFAAVDGADYPYNFDPRTREAHLAEANSSNAHRLDDALKIVTDNSFCVKCHLVGDFNPKGSDRPKGPQLANVNRRLRPDYVLDWVANPKRILPYTGMPVNIPFDKPVNQSLYKGDSVEQLNAVIDLLMNFNRYFENQTSIDKMVKPAEPGAEDNKAAAIERANESVAQDAAQ